MSSSNEFETTSWSLRVSNALRQPRDIFSTLLLLGPDITSSAVAQQCGTKAKNIPLPLAFSFGWPCYSLSLFASSIGAERLMPAFADIPCLVVNGKTGQSRTNNSWILGRVVRDYDCWMDPEAREAVRKLSVDQQKASNPAAANKTDPEKGSNDPDCKPTSLCVALYEPVSANKQSHQNPDWVAWSGTATIGIQIAMSIVSYLLGGDPIVPTVTVIGTLLAYAPMYLSQWKREKWTCRTKSAHPYILTQGNGSQHAIVILGNKQGLNLEDLATSTERVSDSTKLCIGVWTALWVFLLVLSASVTEGFGNAWMLGIGGIGMAQNIIVAAWRRHPSALGIHIKYNKCFIRNKVMSTLMEVGRDPEIRDPTIGWNLVKTLFPNGISNEEEEEWKKIREGRTTFTETQVASPSNNVEHNEPEEHKKNREETGTSVATPAEPEQEANPVGVLAVVQPEGSNGSNNLPETDSEEGPSRQHVVRNLDPHRGHVIIDEELED